MLPHRVTERIRRPNFGSLDIDVTIDDPGVFTKIWTVEYPFRATSGPVYEYACHEGNYAMTDIMGGARKAEAGAGRK